LDSAAALGSDGFFLLLPGAMRKEKTVARAAETGVRPQKAPRLEPCRGCCYPSAVEDQADSVAAKIKSRNQAPLCASIAGWRPSEGRHPVAAGRIPASSSVTDPELLSWCAWSASGACALESEW
jgi:hypothetical protein